jgi:pimeloyl-ACP methyl ester carboxylesterase
LDIRDRSTSIDIPTLIVYGADDHFTKASSLQLRELITRNQQLPGTLSETGSGRESLLKSLPGGHLPHITSPRLFAEMIMSHVTATSASTMTTTTTDTTTSIPSPLPTPTVF